MSTHALEKTREAPRKRRCADRQKRPTAAVALAAVSIGATAQVEQPSVRARVDGDLTQLRTLARGAPVVRLDPAALPSPLRRYVAYTRLDQQPRPVRHAVVRFSGEVRLPQTGSRDGVQLATPWMRMRGTQTMALSANGLGYVWDTHWTNPRFGIDVRDRYMNGQTHIWAVRDDGTTLMDEGDAAIAPTYLVRFFAEATQAPAMLMPGAHLRWDAIDDSSARAHLRDGMVKASMVCRFAPDGALTQCETDERLLRFSGDVPERWVPVRWRMTRGDYREMAGMRLPTTMSVRWMFPGGDWEQVRAVIDDVRFTDDKELEP
jgi:hypothetical protein